MKFKIILFIISSFYAMDEVMLEMIKENEKSCNREVLIAYGLKG